MSSFTGEPKVKAKTRKIKVVVPKSTDVTSHPKLAAFLFGVANSFSTLSPLTGPVLLLNEDYKASINISVNFKNTTSNNLPRKFTFKHRLPKLYQVLRSKFNVSESGYLASFSHHPASIKCNNMNAYISHDGNVIIKVIDSDKVKALIALMSKYYNYVTCKNAVTYLPKYLGLYSVNIEGKKTEVVVMKNMNYSNQEFDLVFKAKCAFIRENKDNEDADDKIKRRISGYSDFQKIVEGNEFQAGVTKSSLKNMLEILKDDFQFICLERLHGMSFMLAKLVGDPAPVQLRLSSDKRTSYSEGKKKSKSQNECIPESQHINPESNDPHEAYVFGIMDLSAYVTSRKGDLHLARNKSKHGEHDIVKPKYKVFAAEKYITAVSTHFKCDCDGSLTENNNKI